MRRVEFLLAWEDGTWSTTIEDVDVPDPSDCDLLRRWLESWAESNLLVLPRYRKVVFCGVMNESVGSND